MNRVLKTVIGTPGVSALIVLIIILATFHLYTGIFLRPRNIELILGIVPELGVVVLGVVILMIAREFDLSVGSVFGLCPMIMNALYTSGGLHPWVAIVLALAACALLGLFNGVMTVYRRIPSFIVTLGMLFMARSMVIVLTGKRPPRPDTVPYEVFVHDFGMFPASLLWFLGLALLLGIILHRTNVGNWIYATGGHTEAAKDMGINWRRIAAAVIGGTSLFGGAGSVLGALAGAFLVRSIDNGFIIARVDVEFFRMALGLLIIAAVIFNTDLQRFASRLRVRSDGEG